MAIYYVDGIKGIDANSGESIDQAWRTVEKVNSADLQPGDVVEFVGDGIVYYGTLKPNESGTADSPIVFRKYSGSTESPIFNGYNPIETAWTPSQGSYVVDLSEAPLVVYADNLKLEQAADLDQLENGQWHYSSGQLHVNLGDDVNPDKTIIEWANGSTDYASITSNYQSFIRFENLHAKTVFNGVTSTGRGIVVQRGSDIQVVGNEASSDKDGPAIGILIYKSPDAVVLQNNVHHQWVGIYVHGPDGYAYSGLVSGNTITDLVFGSSSSSDGIKIESNSDFSGLVVEDNDISGFQQDGIDAFTGNNLTIRNNYIHDSGTLNNGGDINGIKVGPYGTGAFVSGNTIENIGIGTALGSAIAVQSNAVIENNTIINPNIWGINVTKGAENVEISNNSVIGSSVALYVQKDAIVAAFNNSFDGGKPHIISGAQPHDILINGGTVVGDYNQLVNDGVPKVASGGSYLGGEHDNIDPDSGIEPGEPIRIEAEDMDLSNYTVENVPDVASGDQSIAVATFHHGDKGFAETVFNGPDGFYTVVLQYYDEGDGIGQLKVSIDGQILDDFALDGTFGDGGASARSLTQRTLATGVSIETGDILEIEGTLLGAERARVDYIEFTQFVVTTSEGPLRYEAESMTLSNYKVEIVPEVASEGQSIAIATYRPGDMGIAEMVFDGPAGLYSVVLQYFDESDGVAQLKVSVDGEVLDDFALDGTFGDGGASAQSLTQRTLATSVEMVSGDIVEIEGTLLGAERARLDYIEFIPEDLLI